MASAATLTGAQMQNEMSLSNDEMFQISALASKWPNDEAFNTVNFDSAFLKRLSNVDDLASVDVHEGEHEDAFSTAVFCLNHFVATNWTGPFSSTSATFERLTKALSVDSQSKFLDLFAIDGSFPYALVKDPFSLALSKQIFNVLEKTIADCKIFSLRALFLHQRIIEEPSVSLKEKMDALIGYILDNDYFQKSASLFLEFSVIKLYYGEEKQAGFFVEKAAQSSAFESNLTGVMGKRTKFQQFEISQLVVEVKKSTNTNCNDRISPDFKPENIDLNDDTLLNDRELAVNDEQKQGIVAENVEPIDQCILLQKSYIIKENTCESEVAAREQMMAYVERVLRNPNNWTVFSFGLFMRSKLESHDHRKVERSVLQLQALYDQTKLVDAPLSERLKYFFCIPVPTIWEIECQAAYIFRRLGALMTAIDIFVRLELWTDAVECLLRAEKIPDAERIVSKQLEKNPADPKMWYLMGIIKDCSVELFHKSWEISKGTYTKPLRMLGKIYYDLKDFDQSIDCLEKALKVNSLFEDSWFLLGCCYMNIEQLQKALASFHRVVVLNYENGQAWANIATIQWTLNRPKESLIAFKTAIKFFFDNWKMWDNIVTASLACFDWKECFWAATKIVELAPSSDSVMNSLISIKTTISAIPKACAPSEETPNLNVVQKFFDLMARCENASISSSFKFWLFYAECCEEFAPEKQETIVDCLSKAYRCLSTVSLVDSPNLLQPACIVIEKLFDRTKNTSIINKFIAKYNDNFSKEPSFMSLKTVLESSK